MSPFAFYAPHLRKLGFRKTWRSQAGGERMDEWTRHEPVEEQTFARKLIVQVWANGGHRITHWIYTDPVTCRLGCCSTVPTDFDNPGELRAAIEIERTRTDNSYYKEKSSK